ncbi:MAG: outer membrane lipoprotein-sorting protein [Opitutales bacterium]|nr:outer membrane lipoprotein-sorting protein [Opitutales bacterium]
MKTLLKIFAALILAAASALPAFGQARKSNKAAQVRDISQADAARRWSEFLESRPSGDYVFKFELEHMPRQSESAMYEGEIFGKYFSAQNFLMRVEIRPAQSPEKTKKYLLKKIGGKIGVWEESAGKIKKLDDPRDWLRPMLEGLIYTPFDVLMPFKSWPCKYAGAGRAMRAVHFFDLCAPDGFPKGEADLSRVRVALSREFNAPFQTEYFDAKGEVSKAVNLSSVKKIDGNWIVKKIETLDKKSRDKDKITILRAGFFDALDPKIFDESALAEPAKIPELKEL